MHVKQQENFNLFLSSFPPHLIKEWEAMALAWEADKQRLQNVPNPYREKEIGMPHLFISLCLLLTMKD